MGILNLSQPEDGLSQIFLSMFRQ